MSNRNSESHFSMTPTIGIARSKFDRSYNNTLTGNAADLIPIYCDCTIMPGDTVKMNVAHIVRMMTPIAPVMGNSFIDVYFFFVPNRLIWKNFKRFWGENDTAPWKQTVEYQIPQINAPTGGWTKGSLADYLGWPTLVDDYQASALPFRAYALIWNEFFRSENLKNPCYISDGDSDANGVDILSPTYDYVTDTELGAAPCKAAKPFDYFTSCLPEPQKGPSVNVPIGTSAPIVVTSATGTTANPSGYTTGTTNNGERVQYMSGNSANAMSSIKSDGTYHNLTSQHTYGLEVDLSNAVGATVNQLRQAFAIQRFYEKAALYGSRYIETVKGHWQVTNPDYRLQRPEYLGGFRQSININAVVQTDATSQQLGGKYVEGNWTWEMSDLTPQGNTAAYSVTTGKNGDLFTHSFTEHGILMGLCCIRQQHVYQQGLNRQFIRKKMTDMYVPEFANLGNMEVYNMEIMTQGTSADKEVFGYQEAWADYRYFPDQVCGEMRSNYAQSLDIWHYADDYATLPSLGSDWIDETKENIARTLAVQNHDQFLMDFNFSAIYTRAMPLYSVPGLIDHH